MCRSPDHWPGSSKPAWTASAGQSLPDSGQNALITLMTDLGGHFGPEQKNIWPPPPQIPCRHPPGPLALPPFLGDTLALLGFSIKKTDPTPPCLSPWTPPSPPPSRKNKKYPKRSPSDSLHKTYHEMLVVDWCLGALLRIGDNVPTA